MYPSRISIFWIRVITCAGYVCAECIRYVCVMNEYIYICGGHIFDNLVIALWCLRTVLRAQMQHSSPAARRRSSRLLATSSLASSNNKSFA